jgi:hypothetical protein
MGEDRRLTSLERELLELCRMSGETTRSLDKEVLGSSPGRGELETVLHGLVARGLMTTKRGVYAGVERSNAGSPAARVTYEDDWWDVTAAGRAVLEEPISGGDVP